MRPLARGILVRNCNIFSIMRNVAMKEMSNIHRKPLGIDIPCFAK